MEGEGREGGKAGRGDENSIRSGRLARCSEGTRGNPAQHNKESTGAHNEAGGGCSCLLLLEIEREETGKRKKEKRNRKK